MILLLCYYVQRLFTFKLLRRYSDGNVFCVLQCFICSTSHLPIMGRLLCVYYTGEVFLWKHFSLQTHLCDALYRYIVLLSLLILNMWIIVMCRCSESCLVVWMPTVGGMRNVVGSLKRWWKRTLNKQLGTFIKRRSFLCYRLALYVYEYLLHVGAQKSAQTFLSEVCTYKCM